MCRKLIIIIIIFSLQFLIQSQPARALPSIEILKHTHVVQGRCQISYYFYGTDGMPGEHYITEGSLEGCCQVEGSGIYDFWGVGQADPLEIVDEGTLVGPPCYPALTVVSE